MSVGVVIDLMGAAVYIAFTDAVHAHIIAAYFIGVSGALIDIFFATFLFHVDTFADFKLVDTSAAVNMNSMAAIFGFLDLSWTKTIAAVVIDLCFQTTGASGINDVCCGCIEVGQQWLGSRWLIYRFFFVFLCFY